jgi:folate-binding protein YgfZ
MSTHMQAALLPERGVVKVAGEDARGFLNGLATNDIGKVTPDAARFAALLTPQGKIVVDFFVIEASAEDGGGFFIDVPRALADTLVQKLKFYKLRAKVAVEDLSEALGVMAVWDGAPVTSDYGLSFTDSRLPALGSRIILPPQEAGEAAAELGSTLVSAEAYDAHRIRLGVPRGGSDFIYGDTFPHEADMDQLGGVDFHKGCYVGQEVVSRVEHRHTARSRVVPVEFENAPWEGLAVIAGDKAIGTMGSSINGRGLALLRLDRVADAMAAGTPLTSGNVEIKLTKPDWATFEWPGESKAAS